MRRTKHQARLTPSFIRGSEVGAVDLTSIMVGGIVALILAGIIGASVFVAVPWAQDNTAKQKLSGILAAQQAAKIKNGGYLDRKALLEEGHLASAPEGKLDVAADDAGACWVAASTSETGKTFYITSKSSDATETKPARTICDAEAGWVYRGDGTPFASTSSTYTDGKVRTNRMTSPTPSGRYWSSNNNNYYNAERDTKTVRRPGSTSVQSRNVAGGNLVLSLYAVGAGWARSVAIDVTPGETITYSVYFMSNRESEARVGINFTDDGGETSIRVYSDVEKLSHVGAWQRLSVTAKVPNGITAARFTGDVWVTSSGPYDGNERAWAQDAQLDSGPEAKPYIDGSMRNAWWGKGGLVALSEQ